MRQKFKPVKKESKYIIQKTFDFSLCLIEFYIFLSKNQHVEFSDRMLKSGTGIRENLELAFKANTKQDFISKISLASKDALEARYWLKEIQMNFIQSSACDNCVELINEILIHLNHIVVSNIDSEVKLHIEYLN
jgi:four helix bundle protein